MKASSVAAMSSVILALVVTAPAMAADEREDPADTQASQLPTKRVGELTGTKVINEKGEEIGKVEGIVRHKTSNDILAVVSVGGFLGIGTHDVTIALRDLALRGDRLVAPPGTTKEQLKNMPEYDERAFQTLPDEQVVTVGSRATHGGGSR